MKYLDNQRLLSLGEAVEHCPALLDILDAGFQLLADEERDRCVSASVTGAVQQAAVYAGRVKALEEAIGDFKRLMDDSLEELARLPETEETGGQ